MKQDPWKPGQKVDLSNCAHEPIHIPGRIQPHGVLLALSASDDVIRHASLNVEAVFGQSAESLIGKNLEALLGKTAALELKRKVSMPDLTEVNPIKIDVSVGTATQSFDVIAHGSDDLLILEFERTSSAEGDVSFSNIYRKINSTIKKIESAPSLTELCRVTAEQAKVLSGFHRVMIYQFDEEWNGKVVAEAKEEHLEPFLGLHYPASDIPAQARALYLSNWIRLMPHVDYQPSDIVPARRADTQRPIDLSGSVLRSVSPMHIQYLKNMGVGASMSVSIIKDNRLWGLIAFHHETARYLPYELRQGLEFIGRHFSLQIAATEKLENVEYKDKLKFVQERLFGAMRKSSEFLSGLHTGETSFLEMAEGVSGGAIYYRGKLECFGKTPSQEQMKELLEWLKTKVGQKPVFYSTSLASEFEEAARFKEVASGILCLSIPEPDPSYVLWFKPEVIQTVNWGGDPEKPVEITESGTKLSPRGSFSLWQQTVRLKSLPWQKEEIEAIEALRRLMIEVDLERQVSVAMQSNAELDQFAHVVSHDLKEPLRGIGHFAEFIRKDEADQLKPESKANLAEISQLAEKAKRLISTLHEYSKVGRVEFSFAKVDLNEVVQDVAGRLKSALLENHVELRVPQKLPVTFCDQARIAEVFANLISNSIKYNDQSKKWIEVGFIEKKDQPAQFYVRDNGIGISALHHTRIFKMFERLHSEQEYGGGSGSGLALVKRIIDRHSGKIWVESVPGQGTTFLFTLAPESGR